MSHFGGGHGGHGGHAPHCGHGGHHAGGHPDQSPLWNSAVQGGGKQSKFITALPNPTIMPIFLALGVFLIMLLPFIIEWDYDMLPWMNHQQAEETSQNQVQDAGVQADRDLLDATKNSMLQAQYAAHAEAAANARAMAAEEAGVNPQYASQEQLPAASSEQQAPYQVQNQGNQNYYPAASYSPTYQQAGQSNYQQTYVPPPGSSADNGYGSGSGGGGGGFDSPPAGRFRVFAGR